MNSTIDIFVDIITFCQLKCNYCTSVDHKEWSKKVELDKIKKLAKYIALYNGKVNIILFGGEPTLHTDISSIILEFRNMKNINDIILLSHGITTFDYSLTNVKICLTLHNHISDKQFSMFLSNVKKFNNIKDMFVHFILPKDKTKLFISRHDEIINNLKYKSNIKYSMIYDFNTHFNNVYINNFNIINTEFNKYKIKIQNHVKIIPINDISYCYIKELNINIDGDIHNDCINIKNNIYTNPLFFKNYNNQYNNCSKNKCFDCTGTIYTNKVFKDSI